jgi:hypothetical protein
MTLLPLHGATGFWDEIICLIVPATAIMGVALAVMKQQPPDAEGEDESADPDEGASPPPRPQVHDGEA